MATVVSVTETEQGSGMYRRLLDNILSLYVLQGLNYVIPVAVLPYLVRVLGMETYGLIAFAQSFSQYFTIFTDYGFNFSATRSIAQNPEDNDEASKLFCSVFVIKLALMILGAVILVGVVLSVPQIKHERSFFLVGYLAVIGNVLFPVWFFQGVQRMRYISLLTGAARLIAAISLFIFVHKPSDGLLAIAIQSVGTLGAGIVGFGVALRVFTLRLQWPTFAGLKGAMVDGWNLFLSTAAVSLYTNTNVFLVGMLGGNVQAGYFSAAEKLIRGMQGLIVPIAQGIFPHVNALASRSKEAALQFIWQSLRWIGGVTFLSSLLMFLFARPIAVLCFGSAAAGSVPVVRWIAWLPFLIGISNVLGVQTMVTFGFDKQFSRILILAGLVNLALAIPLISSYGAQGAGASVLVTETLVTMTMVFVLQHNGISLFAAERITA